jgi:hypothetical protein
MREKSAKLMSSHKNRPAPAMGAGRNDTKGLSLRIIYASARSALRLTWLRQAVKPISARPATHTTFRPI